MLRPGSAVSLDNLQAHKLEGVREAIEAVGVRLLPPRPSARDSLRYLTGLAVRRPKPIAMDLDSWEILHLAL